MKYWDKDILPFDYISKEINRILPPIIDTEVNIEDIRFLKPGECMINGIGMIRYDGSISLDPKKLVMVVLDTIVEHLKRNLSYSPKIYPLESYGQMSPTNVTLEYMIPISNYRLSYGLDKQEVVRDGNVFDRIRIGFALLDDPD